MTIMNQTMPSMTHLTLERSSWSLWRARLPKIVLLACLTTITMTITTTITITITITTTTTITITITITCGGLGWPK